MPYLMAFNLRAGIYPALLLSIFLKSLQFNWSAITFLTSPYGRTRMIVFPLTRLVELKAATAS